MLVVFFFFFSCSENIRGLNFMLLSRTCLFNVWYFSVTQLSVFRLVQSCFSFFFASLRDTHTHTRRDWSFAFSPVCACVCVCFRIARQQPALSSVRSLQLCKHSVTLLFLGIRCRSAVECKSEAAALFPAPVDLSLISLPSRPLRAEDEDLGSETTVGSLTGHQQSPHQITEHVQVGRSTFLLFYSLF